MIYRLLRAFAAGVALIGLALGVPVLLVLFGRSPLDGTGSIWDQLAELPTQVISDNMAFGLLTVAAWVSWAVFAANVAAEVAGVLGRGGRWPIPAGGPFQLTVRRLVMAATMSMTLGSSLVQRSSAVPILTTAVSASSPVPDPAVSSWQASPAEATDDAVGPLVLGSEDQVQPPDDRVAGTLPIVTVVPGDSPWVLAERHLGNGIRWRELWDLNRGVPQPDGRAWMSEDLIRPGWQLKLPADAVDVPEPSSPSPPSADQTSCEPTTLPPPDDEDAGFPPPNGDAGRQEAPGAPVDTAPTAPETTNPSTSTTDAVDDSVPRADDEGDEGEMADDSEDERSWPAVPLLGTAGTLLAVAMVRELRRRRARRATVLPVSAVPGPPPRVPVGPELLARADDAAADRLGAALTHLALSTRPRSDQQWVQPRVVYVVGNRIEVLLDRPHPIPPPPWRREAAGLVWVLDEDQEVPWEDDVGPLPALVTVGVVGDADILIDLEAYGVVALIGDVRACEGLARSMVAELSARNEGSVSVGIVGDILEDDSSHLDGVRRHRAWDPADIETAEGSARLLDAGGWPHTWAARASGRIYDGWPPTVWIAPASEDQTYRDIITAIDSRPGAGSAIVVVGADPGCGLRVQLGAGGDFEIPELGLRGEAQRLEAEVAEQLTDLLEDAATVGHETTLVYSDSDGVHDASRSDEPAPKHHGSPTTAGIADDRDYEDPPFDVLVRVCGPIRVEGGSAELPQRETAVAAYVALNGVVDVERIRDAVWAGAGVSLKRARNVISTVRQAVGDAIMFTADHRLTTGPGLITDLELIRRRMSHAEQQSDPRRRAEILHGALEWVTGRVCWYPDSRRRCWTWLDIDNWIPHIESVVATAASQLGRLYLDLGEGQGVCEAARRGTEAVGRRDELTILEVRGYELLGDEASARSTIRSHERYLNELGVDEFDDELLELLDRYATPAHHKATG